VLSGNQKKVGNEKREGKREPAARRHLTRNEGEKQREANCPFEPEPPLDDSRLLRNGGRKKRNPSGGEGVIVSWNSRIEREYQGCFE